MGTPTVPTQTYWIVSPPRSNHSRNLAPQRQRAFSRYVARGVFFMPALEARL